MKRALLKIAGLSLLAAAIALAPTQGLAQEKKETTEKKEGGKKQGGIPFRGKVDAINKTAKTIKVGERTFQITSETRIMKGGKPATLDDGVVGDEVGGQYKEVEGKLNVLTVRFGPRPEGEPKGEKKKKE